MRILITGANGFLGRNLECRLKEAGQAHELLRFTRQSAPEDLQALVDRADFIFHLAGVNRPPDLTEFTSGNADLTARLCEAVKQSGRRIPVVHTSSTQAEADNPYGRSKRAAEQSLENLRAETGGSVRIFRLPNVFGKWSRPNYNSAVATFCHNIARDLPIQIHDPSAQVSLVYVDDVVTTFIAMLSAGADQQELFGQVEPVYRISVGDLADQIRAFQNCRSTLVSERVGTGLVRALYATYVSFLPPERFSYQVPAYGDPRGVFVEMLKTPDAGQFSFFTARPGITRGGHYHHTKTEKFLVISGKARFRFRHIVSEERYELFTSEEKPQIVETIPGWAHDITNVGDSDMIVMLWANEIFDRANPDTIAQRVFD